MPDGRQPGDARAGQRSLARCLGRCLVLTGGAIAAWLLASGIASAADAPQSPEAAVTGLLGLPEPPGPEQLPPVTEVPGEVAGLIEKPATGLPGLDQLSPLDGLPALDEPPVLGEPGDRPEPPPVQRPEPGRPDAAQPQTTVVQRGVDVAPGDNDGGDTPPSYLVNQAGGDVHHEPADPVDVPEVPVEGQGADVPCPASPGQPAPTQAGASPCAVEPAGVAAAAAAARQLRPSPQGAAAPRQIADQPGTTPD